MGWGAAEKRRTLGEDAPKKLEIPNGFTAFGIPVIYDE